MSEIPEASNWVIYKKRDVGTYEERLSLTPKPEVGTYE